ncbi:MAG TPA: type II toxin-antitoxin system RelE/ParE family toxin [Patescibacteria group bacterium]|nr:type II toxin-antitoxin system RelE/ParE family toxin [Patescibacteria group bacterium]
MKLYYKPIALKQLRKLQKSDQKKLIRKLELLISDPYVGKQLKGEFTGLYSLRAWPYRIIYQIEDKTLVVYSISQRQGAYN